MLDGFSSPSLSLPACDHHVNLLLIVCSLYDIYYLLFVGVHIGRWSVDFCFDFVDSFCVGNVSAVSTVRGIVNIRIDDV